MFFILPIGHDQEAYSRPYITYAIAVFCLLVHVWATFFAGDYGERIQHAARAFDAELALDDSARISPDVAAELPATLRQSLDPLIAEDADDDAIDPALEDAALALAEAAADIPALRLGYTPADDRLFTLITYQFAHGGWGHLLGNILFLIIAGGVLENFWKAPAYVALFLLTGIAGALAHGMVTSDPTVPLVGASGSIAGLMAGFLIGHSRTKIHLLVFMWFFLFIRSFRISIVAKYLIPIWLVVQLVSLFGGDDGVSYGAHVGGFVAGVLLTLGARQLNLVARDAGYI